MDWRLWGIDAKLDRAQEHLDDLDPYLAAWVSKEEAWDIPRQVNEGKRRYIFSLKLLEAAPPKIAVMGDEIVHHLRSSLDHLACYLVEASGGQETNSTAWPIVKTHGEWKRKVERRKRPWQLWRKEGGGPLAGASAEVRTFIEGEQPYKRGGKARDDALFELEELWNTEKHRIVNPIPLYPMPTSWRDFFKVVPDIEPVEFRWIVGPDDELKLNTPSKLALFRFPLDQPLPNVIVDGKLRVDVAMGDGKGHRIEIQETLDLIRRIVSDAKTLFPA